MKAELHSCHQQLLAHSQHIAVSDDDDGAALKGLHESQRAAVACLDSEGILLALSAMEAIPGAEAYSCPAGLPAALSIARTERARSVQLQQQLSKVKQDNAQLAQRCSAIKEHLHQADGVHVSVACVLAALQSMHIHAIHR
jgi:hypothetical protein